jgi:hypothetical protein
MKSDVQVLEADVLLFSSKKERETISEDTESVIVEVEKRTLKIDIKNRFARLKRTMRKRSVSIL